MYRSNVAREYIRIMHAFHRITYMEQRKQYAERINNACLFPNNYYNMTGDGMAQNHTKLPFLGQHDQAAKKRLDYKLQGMLAHGREFVAYIVNYCVAPGANLAVHCFLCMLEREYYKDGKLCLPEVIYYQVDGGPENANNLLLAVCELLVAKRLCRKVVLTRLPPGHSHCDIDGLFGVIWKGSWSQILKSASQWCSHLYSVLKKLGIKVEVIDIFVLPDYDAYLGPYIGRVQRAFKECWTQLQWTFEAYDFCPECTGPTKCLECNRRPTGVNVYYSAYSVNDREKKNLVYEIRRNPNKTCGAEIIEVEVGVYPKEGLYILKSIPGILLLCTAIISYRPLNRIR